jgi:hypothetical protein
MAERCVGVKADMLPFVGAGATVSGVPSTGGWRPVEVCEHADVGSRTAAVGD